MIVGALQKWYNITEPISSALFGQALSETGRPNATTFDMVDIRLHHTPAVEAIESDGSFRYVRHLPSVVSIVHSNAAVQTSIGAITTP